MSASVKAGSCDNHIAQLTADLLRHASIRFLPSPALPRFPLFCPALLCPPQPCPAQPCFHPLPCPTQPCFSALPRPAPCHADGCIFTASYNDCQQTTPPTISSRLSSSHLDAACTLSWRLCCCLTHDLSLLQNPGLDRALALPSCPPTTRMPLPSCQVAAPKCDRWVCLFTLSPVSECVHSYHLCCIGLQEMSRAESITICVP